MVIQCKRCGAECANKYYILRHLGKKKPCNALFDSIEIDKYIDELTKKKVEETPTNFKCNYCTYTYAHRSGRTRHEKTCEAQPGPDLNECALKTSLELFVFATVLFQSLRLANAFNGNILGS